MTTFFSYFVPFQTPTIFIAINFVHILQQHFTIRIVHIFAMTIELFASSQFFKLSVDQRLPVENACLFPSTFLDLLFACLNCFALIVIKFGWYTHIYPFLHLACTWFFTVLKRKWDSDKAGTKWIENKYLQCNCNQKHKRQIWCILIKFFSHSSN